MGPRLVVETVVRTRDPVAAVTPQTPVLCELNGGVPPRSPPVAAGTRVLADLGVLLQQGTHPLGERSDRSPYYRGCR